MTTIDTHRIGELRDFQQLLASVTLDHRLMLDDHDVDEFAVLSLDDFYQQGQQLVVRELNQIAAQARHGETKSLAEVRAELLGR